MKIEGEPLLRIAANTINSRERLSCGHALAWLGVLASPSALLFLLVSVFARTGPTVSSAAAMLAVIVFGYFCAKRCARRSHWVVTLLVGWIIAFKSLHTAIFSPTPPWPTWPTVEGQAGGRIAIVGGGPSGLAALWFLRLHASERDVTLYEAESYVGGHSTTIMEGGNPIDIGFIFSTPRYETYGAFNRRYNVTRERSDISVVFHGDPKARHPKWNNIGGHRARSVSSKLAAEISRFREYVSAPPTTLRMLMPLGFWLRVAGFSTDFRESVLRPMLTPLFVTSRGCMMQSAQATINNFGPKGFLSLDLVADGSPTVYHTIGGVSGQYQKMLAEAGPSPSQLKLNTPVTRVSRLSSGKWQVWTARVGGVGGECRVCWVEGRRSGVRV
jgi:hypothetical protein